MKSWLHSDQLTKGRILSIIGDTINSLSDSFCLQSYCQFNKYMTIFNLKYLEMIFLEGFFMSHATNNSAKTARQLQIL